jgi:N-acetylglucosamine-6-phosphate deacetylase
MVNRIRPDQPLALLNGRLILPDDIVSGVALVIEGYHIARITEPDLLEKGVMRVDVGGRFISPGFVDIHTHGALGRTFNEPTFDAYETITRENARRGTTSLLATTASAPVSELVACLDFCRTWMQRADNGSRLLGMHLEGPYFCAAECGAQNPAHLRSPDDGTPALLLEAADVIKILSYAPELPGALALTSELVERGIVPAAGHSCAVDDKVLLAAERGLSHVIHLWSGQSSTRRVGPWRKAGLLETTLASESFTAEMIADNRHLPRTLMRLAYHCLGPDRLCIISDATSGAGLPEGTPFELAGISCEVRDGVAMVRDGTQFAGSTTFLGQMLPILTEVAGIPLVEAVRMMTRTPARIVGEEKYLGSLEAGKYADLVVLEDDFSVWRTMINGRWVYESTS